MPTKIDYLASAAEKRIIYQQQDEDTQALKDATPEQIQTFVDANVTDLASAKLLLARLAIVVAGIIR